MKEINLKVNSLHTENYSEIHQADKEASLNTENYSEVHQTDKEA